MIHVIPSPMRRWDVHVVWCGHVKPWTIWVPRVTCFDYDRVVNWYSLFTSSFSYILRNFNNHALWPKDSICRNLSKWLCPELFVAAKESKEWNDQQHNNIQPGKWCSQRTFTTTPLKKKKKAEKQQIQGLNNHALESDILGLNVISATY
jgi:hypothetical protein